LGFPDLKIIIILLLLGAALSLFLLKPAGQEPKPYFPAQPAAPECSNKDVKNCISHNCTGSMACKSGKWSTCIADEWECRPGQITACSLNSCQFGVKICDSCGKYGQCVPKEQETQATGWNATGGDAGCGNSTP